MSTELELREWVDGWLRDRRAQLMQRNVTCRVTSSETGQFPKAKAVLRFEAPTSLMQVDLWGSGEAEVMELRDGNMMSRHKSFQSGGALRHVLDGCFDRLAAG